MFIPLLYFSPYTCYNNVYEMKCRGRAPASRGCDCASRRRAWERSDGNGAFQLYAEVGISGLRVGRFPEVGIPTRRRRSRRSLTDADFTQRGGVTPDLPRKVGAGNDVTPELTSVDRFTHATPYWTVRSRFLRFIRPFSELGVRLQGAFPFTLRPPTTWESESGNSDGRARLERPPQQPS